MAELTDEERDRAITVIDELAGRAREVWATADDSPAVDALGDALEQFDAWRDRAATSA